MNEIIDYLNELIPNPVCELVFHKDYELLMAVMLSAQTTDKRVNQVTPILFSKYPTIEDLKNASVEDIMDIIRPLGTYHRKAQNVKGIAERLFLETGGKIPYDREFLESLPGVGRKTANVVLGMLYAEPCVAVDTHVARVSVRLGFARKTDDVLVIEQKLTKKFKDYDLMRIHHQLLLFGRYYCKAKSPMCEQCKLSHLCKEQKKNVSVKV